MTSGGGLLERDEVIDAVAALVGAVGAGQAGALFVVGEAGLGKTALLGYGRDLATAAGLRTGFGRGHPMEGALPFGVLAQVLDAAGGRGLLQEDRRGPRDGGERAARFFAVLRWLERRGEPVLLVVDDLHWADEDSLALAVFVCRRLPGLPTALLAGLRPWPGPALEAVLDLAHEGCARMERLAPLSAGGAAALLAGRVGHPVPAEVARRAARLCAGNPLLLEQVALAIGRGEEVPDVGETGSGAIGAELLLARFAGLPAAGMACVRAASVLGTRFVPQVAALVAGLDVSETDAALESLGRSGLIEQDRDGEAGFVHPLFRQALYDDLGVAMRTRLHARAFAVLAARGLDAAAAEHAIHADLAGDASAVGVLERAGRMARRAGALHAAVTRLNAAVELTAGRAGPDLLLAQAEALLADGRPDQAAGVCQGLLARPGLPAGTAVQARWMLGRALVMTGAHDQAHAVFGQAADLAEPNDPQTAAEVLLDAAYTSMLTAGPARALPVAARARELADPIGGGLRTRADACWGEIALQAGDPAGMAAAEPDAPWLVSSERPVTAADMPSLADAWSLFSSFGHSALLVERLAEADRAFIAARAAADQASSPHAIAFLAVGHAYALTRMGRLDEALTAMQAGRSLVDLVPFMDSWTAVGLAYIQLYRGDLDDSAAWCQRAEATATARGERNALLFAWDVAGHRALREGDPGQACEHYARLEATVHRMGMGEPCLPPWPRHAIGAYLAAGRADDAKHVLAWTEDRARPMPCRFPRIAAATGRAWLAELRGDHDAAEARFGQAVAMHQEVDLPVDHAETLLAFGGFLRRHGQQARARQVLARAIQVAQAAQAGWLAGLAHAELRVAGGRRRHPAGHELTTQEARVAALTATGASNPQIARQLSVSVSTVETHLERIYAKLGVHSRHELIAAAARGGIQPDAAGGPSQQPGTAKD
jgi:DNA-binding CsgD family transcriptional regulator